MPQILKILLLFLGVLVLHLSLMYFGRSHFAGSSGGGGGGGGMKLIIDTDAGSDDAVALLLALSRPDKLHVLAITCSYGNTWLRNVETNVLKVLTIAARSDIAVYAGAQQPLLHNFTAGDYFGNDGLGDFEFGRKIEGSVDRSKHAAMAMIDIVKRHPAEVSILTLGPLTNVALAIKLDPAFAKNVKRFYVMGSAINQSQENSSEPHIEFNFSLDPQANAIFLNTGTNAKSLIAPWDLVQKSAISKEWRKQVLGAVQSERVEFLNQAELALLERLGVWHAADSITVAVLIWPELIASSIEARMLADDTCGSNPGAVKLDYETAESNVQIVWDIDLEGFKDKLLAHLAA